MATDTCPEAKLPDTASPDSRDVKVCSEISEKHIQTHAT